MKWSKLNPFKRTECCHVPLLAGEASTFDTQGGVVDGMVEHPEHGETKFIEFVGIVLDADVDESLHWKYGELLDQAKQLLQEGAKDIQLQKVEDANRAERDRALLEEFDPASDMTMYMGPGLTFSFWEDESSNIVAYGHRDKEKLAREIVVYDDYCSGMTGSSLHAPDEIDHHWARKSVKYGEIGVEFCDVSETGAFPVTAISNVR